MGATEQRSLGGACFNLVVDRAIQSAPCATMIVKSHLPQARGATCLLAQQKFHHILVPTVGSDYSRKAVEIACSIAADTQGTVSLLNAIAIPESEYMLFDSDRLGEMSAIARDMLEQQSQLGRSLGADVTTHLLQGNIPEQSILHFARAHQVDLIVMGSSLRMVTGRVFLGHRIDAILDRAHCPVAVIVAS